MKQLAGIHNVILCSSDEDVNLVRDIMGTTGRNVVVVTPSTYTIARLSRYGGGESSESSRDLRPAKVFAKPRHDDDESATQLREELHQQEERLRSLRPKVRARCAAAAARVAR